ncbi:Pkinase domain containing protein [Trichuris trichiura]|uniref:Membrane-associated tyrosine- and threonine-specific cdc2-inhibitory kinase wee-1.3 n=1 Tax=Trichuris trichiura TaxID=36087 RepID=A0A077ZE67_TRITR|nr:Pkinase domain containing protein [Trichuris trichiura]
MQRLLATMEEEKDARTVCRTPLPTPKFLNNMNGTWSTKRVRPFTRLLLLSTLNHIAEGPFVLPMTHYDRSKEASYFEQCFINRQMIGEGSFGEVYRAECLDDGLNYAVKKSMELFKNGNDRKFKLREVEKYEALPPHPNIVKFIKAWEENGYFYIQTELCERNLTDYLNTRSSVDDQEIRTFLIDLLHAVKHLHDRGYVHLDIKPDNIFLTEEGIVKLGDFGLMFNLNGPNEDRTEGDSKYLANEVLRGEVGQHCDVFSVGVTLLEMCCDLDVPAQGETWQMLRRGTLPYELIASIPSDLCELIQQMLNPNYKERPSVSDLLRSRCLCSYAYIRTLYVSYRDTVRFSPHVLPADATINFQVYKTKLWITVLWFLTVCYLKPLLHRIDRYASLKAIGIGTKGCRKRHKRVRVYNDGSFYKQLSSFFKLRLPEEHNTTASTALGESRTERSMQNGYSSEGKRTPVTDKSDNSGSDE